MTHVSLSHTGQSKSHGQVQGQVRGILQGKRYSHGDQNKLVAIITPVYHSLVL